MWWWGFGDHCTPNQRQQQGGEVPAATSAIARPSRATACMRRLTPRFCTLHPPSSHNVCILTFDLTAAVWPHHHLDGRGRRLLCRPPQGPGVGVPEAAQVGAAFKFLVWVYVGVCGCWLRPHPTSAVPLPSPPPPQSRSAPHSCPGDTPLPPPATPCCRVVPAADDAGCRLPARLLHARGAPGHGSGGGGPRPLAAGASAVLAKGAAAKGGRGKGAVLCGGLGAGVWSEAGVSA